MDASYVCLLRIDVSVAQAGVFVLSICILVAKIDVPAARPDVSVAKIDVLGGSIDAFLWRPAMAGVLVVVVVARIHDFVVDEELTMLLGCLFVAFDA